jgi:hypothetical protein
MPGATAPVTSGNDRQHGGQYLCSATSFEILMPISSDFSAPNLGDGRRSDVSPAASWTPPPMTSVYRPQNRGIRKIPELPTLLGGIEIRYAVVGLGPSVIASAPSR